MSEAERDALDRLTESLMKRASTDPEAYKAYFRELSALRAIEKVLEADPRRRG